MEKDLEHFFVEKISLNGIFQHDNYTKHYLTPPHSPNSNHIENFWEDVESNSGRKKIFKKSRKYGKIFQ